MADSTTLVNTYIHSDENKKVQKRKYYCEHRAKKREQQRMQPTPANTSKQSDEDKKEQKRKYYREYRAKKRQQQRMQAIKSKENAITKCKTNLSKPTEEETLERKRKYYREYMRKRRENQNFRKLEKKKDAESKRVAMKDVVRRCIRNKSSTKAMKLKRQKNLLCKPAVNDNINLPSKQTLQIKLRNANSMRKMRQNPGRRMKEQLKDTARHSIETSSRRSNYKHLLCTYNCEIRKTPSFICSCCGGLYYKKGTKPFTKTSLKALGCTDDLIATVLYVNQNEHFLCHTCKRTIIQNRVPKMCLVNGFDFPNIPPELKVSNSKP